MLKLEEIKNSIGKYLVYNACRNCEKIINVIFFKDIKNEEEAKEFSKGFERLSWFINSKSVKFIFENKSVILINYEAEYNDTHNLRIFDTKEEADFYMELMTMAEIDRD